MAIGDTNEGASTPEPVVREWRCVGCGRVTEIRWATAERPRRWGPECRRCGELTELVPIEGEVREIPGTLLALLRALMPNLPDNLAGEPFEPAQRPVDLAEPAQASTEAAAPTQASAEPVSPIESSDRNAVPSPTPTPTNARADDTCASSDRRARMPGVLQIITEFLYARRASRRLLRLYGNVRREHPKHSKTALYEEVVVRWSDVDPHTARAVLRRAEQSFSDWDSDREIRLRDVVLYLVADDYVRAHPERHGARSRMARTVARAIPRNI